MNELKNQDVRGDNKPMADTGASMSGNFTKSLCGASKQELSKGFMSLGKITSGTKSDSGKDA